jgi:hypothetical protein
MVKGLDLFRERFRRFGSSFVLIGGVACHEWFVQQEAEFRPTKDLDILIIVEMADPLFVAELRAFIGEGKYAIQEKSEGVSLLYRFAKPESSEYPFAIELFSRRPDGIDLAHGQHVVPIPSGADHHSLSAILLDDDYYALVRHHRAVENGLPFANVTALIPLKARAWVDLSRRRTAGESIDSKNIAKHRNDIFRLAATLPEGPGPILADSIVADLTEFLAKFPENSPEWQGIQSSLKNTVADGLKPASLRAAIQDYFRTMKDGL